MADQTVGLLRVLLTMNAADFESGATKARQSVKVLQSDFKTMSAEAARSTQGFAGSMSGLASKVGSLKGVLGGLGVGLMVKQFVDASGALVDLSASSGLSLSALQRLKFGAEQTGTSIDVVVRAVQFAQKAMSEGDKSFVGALGQIGLKLQDVRAMDPGAFFEEVTAKIAAVQDPAQRTALRMQLLGKGGRELAGDFKALGTEAQNLGLVMSDETVQGGDELGDNWDKLLSIGKSLIGSVLTPFLPALNGVATALAYVAGHVGNVIKGFYEWLSPAVRWKQLLADINTALEVFGLRAMSLPKPVGDTAKAVESWNDAIKERAAAPLTMTLEEEEAAYRTLEQQQTKNKAAWEAEAEAQKKANQAADDYIQRVDDIAQALEQQTGVLTQAQYGQRIADLTELLEAAAKQGPVALKAALDATAVAADELAAKAKKSGLDATIATAQWQQYADTLAATARGMLGFEAALPLRPIGDLTAGLESLTIETQIQATEQQRLTDAYAAFGLSAPQDLQKAADAATRNYQVLVESGTATTTQLREAYAQMIEAQRAATGQVPSLWEAEVLPRIKGVLDTITGASSDAFGDILVGARGFKDAFVDVWHSIQRSIADVLSAILNDFIGRFLKGLLGAMTGAQGGFAGAFAGMFGGGGGIGSLVPGLGGLLGGGGAAAGGIGAAVPISTLFPAGGFGGGAAGAGAAGSGGLFGLGALGTTGLIGGAALGAYGLYKWYQRKQANIQSNDARDAFTSQFGGQGTGEGSGFMNLAAKLTEATGEAGGGHLFDAFLNARKPEAVAKAIADINAALDAYAQKTKTATDAEAAQADAIAKTKTELDEKTKAIQSQMSTLDDELKKLDASEAPEAHMGTVEKRARERIAREKADLQQQLDAAKEAAAAAIEAIKTAGTGASDQLKTQGQDVIDGLKDGFVNLGDLTKEQIDRIRVMLQELGKNVPTIRVPVEYASGSYDLPLSVPGHAAGGVFGTPHLARIAEGGQPEMVGSVGFMSRALEGALARVGGSTGRGETVVILQVDGREFARAIAQPLPGEVRRLGVRVRA